MGKIRLGRTSFSGVRTCCTVLLLTAACTAPSSDEAAEASEDHLGPRVGSTLVGTDQQSLRLLDGYNSLLDQGSPSCLKASGGTPALSVGNSEEKFELRYVDSRASLAKELGVDLGLGIHFGPVNANIGFGVVKSFKQSSTSVTFLLQATQAYTVQNLRTARLEPEPMEALKRDDGSFLQRCGDSYVNGVGYEAQLAVLIRYDAASEETARQITADIGGGGGGTVAGHGLQIDGNIKTKLVNNTQRSGVTASVMVASSGFLVSGNPTTMVSLGTGINDDTFARIEQLRDLMGKSIREDMCRDGGQVGGGCPAGMEVPGYENNRSRHARASRVVIGNYIRTENAPLLAGGVNPYTRMQEQLRNTESFLRAHAALRVKMEGAYEDEIAPFLRATPEAQSGYNLAAPAAPRLQTEDVRAVVESFAARFHASDGLEAGVDLQKLEDAISDCWRRAATAGDYAACHLGQPPAELPSYRSAAEALEAYRTTARVLPVRATLKGKMRLNNATQACEAAGERLPNRGEVLAVGPLVATRAHKSRAWFADETGACRDQSFLENPRGNQTPRYECKGADWFWGANEEAEALCVPRNGVFGTVRPL